MKFGATDIEHRLVRTRAASPARLRSNQDSGTGTGLTSWEGRIAKAKKLTISRRSDEQEEAFAGKASAAYLHWLEQRTAYIEELRARLETGTYHVDSATLAEDLIRKASSDGEHT
ncbi:MAG TPA: flagellar biosynthesis anti-sigma factor FlgM [Ktedonobacteraceae bacterium]|nr:flagellar biosynthesis anti-sigma factor FlgM [Ktedonobacteraceae bacterium]